MFDDKNKKVTSIKELGEFKLIDHLTKNFELNDPSTLIGVGDDACVIDFKNSLSVISTDLLIENVHFDLTYVPLKHLGYKSVVVNLSDIYSMNARPTQITVSLGISNRFSVEALEEFYEGIRIACKKYKIDLVGGDTSSSDKGMIISLTAIGHVSKNKVTRREGACDNDLLVVSGDLGAAYSGLQILEREKAVFSVNPKSQPDLDSYSYCIGRQLKPEARKDVFELLDELNILPKSMIDISDGLSSEILHICKSSKIGCNIFEDKIPIDPEVIKICDEFKINPLTAALNGGEDYELLMAISQKEYEKIKSHPYLTVIGHFTDTKSGAKLITSMNEEIDLNAQGWNSIS
ncbi:MAG: thiamine-phosphate kinase [Flavobacteriaceae bacterium]|nr:thiamine-phosphate kinase [Flavobacteriaceae bacterium]|tara:strand:+ start:8995 stop:10038 length:1044 start_codon:yes stop_codon:yes gene_type:complete